jgi:hypothetical protein
MIGREKRVSIMLKKGLFHVQCLSILVLVLTSRSSNVTPILAAADLSVDLDYEISLE